MQFWKLGPFFYGKYIFQGTKKMVLTHRTLFAKNVIFLEIAIFFSENENNSTKMVKNYRIWLIIEQYQYTDGTYLISW